MQEFYSNQAKKHLTESIYGVRKHLFSARAQRKQSPTQLTQPTITVVSYEYSRPAAKANAKMWNVKPFYTVESTYKAYLGVKKVSSFRGFEHACLYVCSDALYTSKSCKISNFRPATFLAGFEYK